MLTGIKAVSKTISKLIKSGEEAARDFRDRTRSAKKEHLKPATLGVKKTRSTKSLLSLQKLLKRLLALLKKSKVSIEDGHLGTKLERRCSVLEPA
ncbi:MAG: hypothetical protein GXZ07_06430 [Firmicutes bacterium]|nr:hypothetical protein [Bacillota bacterium]